MATSYTPPLFETTPMRPVLRRGGPQLLRVRAALASGAWWTLAELAAAAGDPQQSVSSRIRDCRKPRLLGLIVQKRRRWGRRHWEYRIPLEGTL